MVVGFNVRLLTAVVSFFFVALIYYVMKYLTGQKQDLFFVFDNDYIIKFAGMVVALVSWVTFKLES